ncbi:hypothetical protein AB0I52_09565 [Streptomyces sp. NPDC050423]|uniref:hypothetical protein n=1 Tax=Streptomyces sp. NPDC050423 TaxID=3155402 RepID=UPI00343336CE
MSTGSPHSCVGTVPARSGALDPPHPAAFLATSGTGSIYTSSSGTFGNGSTSDPASAGADAHYGAAMTYDYFQSARARGHAARAAGLAARAGDRRTELLALGRVRRRLGDEDAAHAASSEALRVFTAAGARAWAATVRAERDRAEDSPIHLFKGNFWSEHLSSTERSVVTRVAQGAANREIRGRDPPAERRPGGEPGPGVARCGGSPDG